MNVAATLATCGLAASRLELEVTEAVLIRDDEVALDVLHQLRKLGIRVALDDFGTGYSSLAYLKRFPFNSVKIDRAFVTDVISNPDDTAIACAIIGMAHSLRMQVISEGVETEEQMNFLRDQGCDLIQGYYFSRPVCAEDFANMLRNGFRVVYSRPNYVLAS